MVITVGIVSANGLVQKLTIQNQYSLQLEKGDRLLVPPWLAQGARVIVANGAVVVVLDDEEQSRFALKFLGSDDLENEEIKGIVAETRGDLGLHAQQDGVYQLNARPPAAEESDGSGRTTVPANDEGSSFRVNSGDDLNAVTPAAEGSDGSGQTTVPTNDEGSSFRFNSDDSSRIRSR